MELRWKFPHREFLLLKIEKFSLLLVTLTVFLLIWLQFQNVVYGALFAFIFVALYLLISYVIQLVRAVEEEYHFTPTRIEINRKTRFGAKKEKVPLQKVFQHRLDPFFLGGYLLSSQGKHLLFFNTKKELADLEEFLKKYL